MSDRITGSVIADRYRVTGFLRSGRMGDIYVARRVADNKKVAVKVLDPGLFDNEEAVKRFEREARVTIKVDHPCTTRVLDYGRAEQGPYLVMEYVEGELLSDVLDEQGALPPQRAARIAGQIALALGAAHAAGVIHRDLAPCNVLVAKQDVHEDLVKVTDFGLSLITHDDGTENTNLTAVGVRIGTPTYMAPEYIEEYELDHRADIYGLGVMLYEMLTGAPPFSGRPYKIMDAHVNTPMPKPSAAKPGIPGWLDDLVLAMTAKKPDDRLADAEAVVRRVEEGLGAPLEVHEYVAPTASPAPQRVERPGPAAPAIDPILAHFLQKHTTRLTRGKATPPPKERMFQVARVAAVSLAGQAGVQPGWWCHLPQETPRDGLLDPDLTLRVVDERVYHFFTPDLSERIELVAPGLPIGLELARSAENVIARYDPIVGEGRALLDLWRHQRWEELEKLSWRTITQQKGPAGLLATGLFARFLGSDKPKLLDHPALLFFGAAQYEQGKTAEGIRLVTDFRSKYAQHWPSVYDAVAYYYAAREKAAAEPKVAIDLLQQSLHLQAFGRAAQLYEELAGNAPAPAPWVGKTFNDYSMDAAEPHGRSVTLSAALAELDPSQLLGVCLMGGFRGNVDYDEFMHRWATLVASFPEFLYALHVVTTKTEPEPDKPQHYRGEGVVRVAGMRFFVLYDYRAFVQRAAKPARIPTIYLLDRTGTVVHEGLLSECDLWDAFAYAGRLRVHRFQGAR